MKYFVFVADGEIFSVEIFHSMKQVREYVKDFDFPDVQAIIRGGTALDVRRIVPSKEIESEEE